MKLSARAEYALKAAYELAKAAHESSTLSVSTIATEHSIPQKFLVQVLLRLGHAGIVKSIRGSGGGYILSQSPSRLTLLDVLGAVDNGILEKHFDEPSRSLTPCERALSQILEKADEAIQQTLSVSLEDFVKAAEETPLDYQI